MNSRVLTGRRFLNTRISAAERKEQRTFDGIAFDSKIEMEYYRDVLKPLANAGRIRELKYHTVFVFKEFPDDAGQPLTYEADFTFLEAPDWKARVQDVKPWETVSRGARIGQKRYLTGEAYRWQKALMKHCYGLEVEEV